MRGAGARLGAACAAVAALGVCASSAVAGSPAATPADAGAKPGEAALASEVEAPARAVRAYWTAARIRAARPVELTLAGAAPRGGSGPGAARASGRSAATVPVARGAAVDEGASNLSLPDRVHGKVFFTLGGGTAPGDYVCSATAVDSNSHALVWTAGHCVNGSDVGAGFASNWIFVPGYRDGARPFGSWTAETLLTTKGWGQNANTRVDLGAAVLARDENGRGIEDAVGGRPIAFNGPRGGTVDAFGYPAQPNTGALRFDFTGERLYSCSSALGSDDTFGPPPGSGPEPLAIECDMTGGSSGGGWVNGQGRVVGVTSYGYQGDFNHLYGPYLGEAAEDLYTEGSGPPLRCAGAEVTNLGKGQADEFTGTDAGDSFRLGPGGDAATGGAGADAICGGGGADRLRGDGDRDRLRGGGGDDVLRGGPGFDVCVGGAGRDRGPGCERKRQIP